MTQPELSNAVIVRTFLGIEDHGIFTFFLHLDYGDSGQGFGGYSVKFIGVAGLRRILEVVGVDSWEALPGHTVRAWHDYSKVYRIGHFLKDQWYDPQAEGVDTEATD